MASANWYIRYMLLVLFSFKTATSSAQIKIDHSQPIEHYINDILVGTGIEVGNVKFVGMVGSLGQFEAEAKIIGVGSGLVLSTGLVDSIVGPNDAPGFTSLATLPPTKEQQWDIRNGDKDLSRLAKGRTTDIAIVEFDFVPIKNVLEFNYVFASEEYIEYVGSTFNDVFAFFLSGETMKRKVNLATIPFANTPVSVNTINNKSNTIYFRKNEQKVGIVKKTLTKKEKLADMMDLRSQLQFDGLTPVLKVRYDVVPYKKYHIKIAIGDVGDAAYDSGVFIEANSFVSVADEKGKNYKLINPEVEKKLNTDSILGLKSYAVKVAESAVNKKYEFTDIYFDTDSYALHDTAKTQLDLLADYLLKNPTFKCSLYGNTDIVGTHEYNQTLSENRSTAVINYLSGKGVSIKRLHYIGFSYDRPRADNETVEGRAVNRRVEIVVEDDEE